MFKRRSKSLDAQQKPDSKKALIYKGPPDSCAYVIGDVHGCLEHLIALLDKIEAHAKTVTASNKYVVFLGDLVDRGPDSFKVVEYLKDYFPDFASTVFLMGNHEEVLLQVATGDSAKIIPSWFEHGGRSTARSYGVDNLGEVLSQPQNLLHRIKRKVPQDHIDFLQGFGDYFIFGDYLCVHAGIKPKIAIENQSSRDLRWIREGFLEFEKPHKYMVVHGHTIVKGPENHINRIAVDTGAYRGGPLTAVFLQDEGGQFLQVNPSK